MPTLKEIESFLLKARLKTYAGSQGKVEALLKDSKQLEYTEEPWLYRDIYYVGKSTFVGIETIYYMDKAVFSMSYYGNWGTMTEDEIDRILRKALINNPKTRLYKEIVWEKDGFKYTCIPENIKGLQEIGGTESITKDGKLQYVFYYAGSVLL